MITDNFGEKAAALFATGMNCAQAVFCAFADVFGMDADTAAKVSSGLGGGVGRMREVCGSVLGAAMVCGLKLGSADPADLTSKAKVYEVIQRIGARFKEANGSIVCRELLGQTDAAPGSATPEARTASYYRRRPCAELVRMAADILEDELARA